MSCSTNIKQYKILIDSCSVNQYPKKETLRDRINIEDKNISNKTLERRIADLKNEFGIEIKFNRTKSGYYVIPESLDENIIYYKRINQYYINDILLNNKQLDFIELDDEELYTGLINIKDLVDAISSNSEVQFDYKKEGSEPKTITVRPWLLKQFEKMWYVLADISNDEFTSVGLKSNKYHRTYALDRISNIKETSNKFTLEKYFEPKDILKNLIGINHNQSITPVKVVFEMSSTKSHLVENLPIHISQKSFDTGDGKTRFELLLKPNQELINRLLRFIDIINIIEPVSLKKEMINILQKGISNNS